ncbi:MULTISPECIES: shikimate dehydrogenase family protein [Hyphomonas]|uniref:shikimate dehydrogenase family protein n=1 Tax=Hyphomonas TaxID=85 RepID=UPI000C500CB4|nr:MULTISPECIES: hypothetical protein [Hyphomonas]MBB38455.1 shikimate dehydrogenase [Hyphomonas sp.]|tara:strand:- start:107 stop:910 length:804 start_codon:yes stop_codon:yes gene_type:complete
MDISGATKIIGFCGSSFASSRIYDVYNNAFRALELDYVYVPFQAKTAQDAAHGLWSLNLHGIGVTIPFKSTIVPYLDEMSAEAARTGAVNVVMNQDGKLVGGNTDGLGALSALEESVTLSGGEKILILGAGGAARAIAAALTLRGYVPTVSSLRQNEAASLGSDIGVPIAQWENRHHEVEAANIIINATPVGMEGSGLETQTPFDTGSLPPAATVMDIVASPINTPLTQQARAAGCTVVAGDRMQKWQAFLKFEIYTGVKPPADLFL